MIVKINSEFDIFKNGIQNYHNKNILFILIKLTICCLEKK